MSDLISRELAVESVKNLYLDDDSTYECPDECNWMIDACIETLRELPAAQQWTPCTEELPEKWEVLCCNKYGDYLLGHPYENESSETGFSAESDEALLTDCIAWMNLPEVWKGEKENEPGE